MTGTTTIEWTDATWNPVTGCTKVSPGYDNCYAERITERFHGKGAFADIVLHPARLEQPLSRSSTSNGAASGRKSTDGCSMGRSGTRCRLHLLAVGGFECQKGTSMCRAIAQGGRRCPSSGGGRFGGGLAARAAAAQRMAAGSGSVMALTGGASATVEVVTTAAGSVVRKRSTTQDPVRDADAEVLASRVAEAIGAPVPAAYRCDQDDDRATVWIEYLDEVNSRSHAVRPLIDSEDGIRLGLLDTLTGTMDRAGNIGVHHGRLVGYDQGEAWAYLDDPTMYGLGPGDGSPYLREPDAPMAHFVARRAWGDGGPWAVEDPPITRTEADRIHQRLTGLRPEFDAAGRGTWLDHSLRVLDTIRDQAIDLEDS